MSTGKIRFRRVRVLDGNRSPIEHEAPKTEAGYREVTVTEGTREALRLWRAAQDYALLALGLAPDADGYVFTSPEDPSEPINPRRVSDTTKAAIKAAKVPDATLHLFRHFAAVFALNAGESFKDVSVWMGHSDPGVTHRNYANYLTSEAAEEAARR